MCNTKDSVLTDIKSLKGVLTLAVTGGSALFGVLTFFEWYTKYALTVSVLFVVTFATIAILIHRTERRADKRITEVIETQRKSNEQLMTVLDDLRAQLYDNSLSTVRLDLDRAIYSYPKEHQAILHLAEHYFIDLGGNSYMFNEFCEWAEEEKVNISYIMERIDLYKEKK